MHFFSVLPRPILSIGISFVFLMFIVNLQISHKAQLLKNREEDKTRIHELERSFVFQSEVMYKQQNRMEEMENVIIQYRNIINDLVNRLNQKQKPEGVPAGSGASHEKTKRTNEI